MPSGDYRISFQAAVVSCSTWWIFDSPVWRCQPVWADRQSRRHVAGNQALQCDFDVRIFLGFALKWPVQKFPNIKTCQQSAIFPRHGKPHNILLRLMWNEWLPAPSLNDCNFRESASISQGLTIHFLTNTPTYCFIFGADTYKAMLWVSLSIFFLLKLQSWCYSEQEMWLKMMKKTI